MTDSCSLGLHRVQWNEDGTSQCSRCGVVIVAVACRDTDADTDADTDTDTDIDTDEDLDDVVDEDDCDGESVSGDPDHDRFMRAAAEACECCMDCSDWPCDGILHEGFCDYLPCICAEQRYEDGYDEDDYHDYEEEGC